MSGPGGVWSGGCLVQEVSGPRGGVPGSKGGGVPDPRGGLVWGGVTGPGGVWSGVSGPGGGVSASVHAGIPHHPPPVDRQTPVKT